MTGVVASSGLIHPEKLETELTDLQKKLEEQAAMGPVPSQRRWQGTQRQSQLRALHAGPRGGEPRTMMRVHVGQITRRDLGAPPRRTALTARCCGPACTDGHHVGPEVSIDGDGATATAGHVQITAGGGYEVSGELADGQIEVNAPDADVESSLRADITSSDGPGGPVSRRRDRQLTLAPGSENRVEDGGDTDFDAAIAADMSLTFGGAGALEVVGNQNEGIASSMHLTFTGGDIHVWAVEDGINANNDDVSEIASPAARSSSRRNRVTALTQTGQSPSPADR